jgi:hypothetical protein
MAYQPKDYEGMMREARKHNAELDEVERKQGFARPSQGSYRSHLWTAMLAIESGLTTGDTEPIAQGQAILEELLARLRILERASN